MINTIKGKVIIEGKIEVLTGLHIGTSGDFSAIGAVDNIVIRDTVTNKPMIPGSSLKGKMRYLLARTKYNTSIELKNIKEEHESIKRLFGSSDPIVVSRLQFQDMLLSDESVKKLEKLDTDLPYTEIKYENTIDRATGVANPRQQERVPAGSEFDFKLVYNVEKTDEFEEDMKNILLTMEVLEDDYLGGHGTRGYGRIKFKNLKLDKKVYIEENKDELDNIEQKLENDKRFKERFGKVI
jgi:CRISPR-associated RAMP protein, csm3 family